MREWRRVRLLRCPGPRCATPVFICCILSVAQQEEEEKKKTTLFLCLPSNLFRAHRSLFSVQGMRWGESRRGSDATEQLNATQQLAEAVPGSTSLFPARVVTRSRPRASPSSRGLDAAQGGAGPCRTVPLPSRFTHGAVEFYSKIRNVPGVQHPFGCSARRQRRMSWCCSASLRRPCPPERRE